MRNEHNLEQTVLREDVSLLKNSDAPGVQLKEAYLCLGYEAPDGDFYTAILPVYMAGEKNGLPMEGYAPATHSAYEVKGKLMR